MIVSVCRPSELGARETAAWHAWQAATGLDNPFLAPEFAREVGEVYASARVAAVEDGGELVAFLPFTQQRMRVATGIAGRLANCQALVCSPDAAVPLAEVVRRAGLSMFEFHALVPAAGEHASRLRRVDALRIDLSDGFEAYLAGARRAGGSFVKEIERKARRLEREHPGAVRFEFAQHDDAAVATLRSWKSSQYRRTGRPDIFAQRSVCELVDRLAHCSTPSLTGGVSTLWIGERLVAADFSLRSTTTYAGWFTSYDTALARWSPGAVATLRLIDATAEHGLDTIDLATGDEEFKRRLASHSTPLCAGWLGRPCVGTAVNRAIHGPTDWAHRYIVSRPQLRRVTRRALQQYGTLRTQIGTASAPQPRQREQATSSSS